MRMDHNSKPVLWLLFLLLGGLLFLSSCSQPSVPSVASPRGTASMTFDGKKVSVDYGRPSMRGRKIMGELVPYNQVWRTGANEATQFTTEADLLMGSTIVPKGTYTLYTIPAPTGWQLIVNRHTGQWGTPYNYEKEELARLEMAVESLPTPVEQFTIALEPSGMDGLLKMEWEQTRATIKFTEKK